MATDGPASTEDCIENSTLPQAAAACRNRQPIASIVKRQETEQAAFEKVQRQLISLNALTGADGMILIMGDNMKPLIYTMASFARLVDVLQLEDSSVACKLMHQVERAAEAMIAETRRYDSLTRAKKQTVVQSVLTTGVSRSGMYCYIIQA